MDLGLDKEKQINIELSVGMGVKGIEHEKRINYTNYTKSESQLIDEVIEDCTDYFIESMRRRLTRITTGDIDHG